MLKKLLKKLLLVGEIFFGLILVLVIIVSVFPLLPPFKNYYHSRTVLTGSMEPKIPKGSVVINQWLEQKNLKVGDVITYQHPSRKKIIYLTHRIVKIDKTGLLWRFETKGDANPAADFGLITQASTEGKVILMIPLLGYLIEFFKTPMGFILLIALPLLIFIVLQTRDVLGMWKKRNVPSLVAILIAFSFLAARVSFVTYASFTSGQATITGVTLNTAVSFPGEVVINELMWMGSTNSEHLADDEWNDSTSPDYVAPTVTPTITLSPMPEASSTPTPTPTVAPELSSELSATSSATTPEPIPTPSPSPEISPTPAPMAEPSPTPEATSTAQLSPKQSPTPSPSPDPSLTISSEPLPSLTPEPTSTPVPTLEPTPTLTPAPSPTPENNE